MNYFYLKKENNSLYQNYNHFILRRIFLSFKMKNGNSLLLFQDCFWLSENDISKVMLMKPLLYEIQLYHFAKFYPEL